MFGAHGRTQLVLLQRLAGGVVDRLLEHFAHQRVAVELAQMADRHLARPEARQADAAGERLQLLVQLVVDDIRLDGDGVLPLEAFGAGFGHLHGNVRILLCIIFRAEDRVGAGEGT